MELILQVIILAFLVEAVVDTLSLILENGELHVNKILALLVGLVIAYITKIDFLNILKITSTSNFGGIALTGILISRGGNFVHDLFDRIKGVEKSE